MGVQLDMIVTGYEPRGGDIWMITLAHHDGQPLPAFEAGAHVEVIVGPELVRPYSLCNDPSESHRYQLGVLKDPASRGASEIICTQWGVGMPVRVSEPRNLFPLNETASHSVLVGGGIGITPLLAMARRLARLGRSFELHYCTRDGARAAFAEEIASGDLAPHARLHYSTIRRFSLPEDVGAPDNEDSHFYICGPDGFMERIQEQALAIGWDKSQIHSEQFSAETDLSGAAFTVHLSDGASVEIPGGRSIAQCLVEAGYELELSCEQGICGTCIATVLEGEPDHRDQYLTEEEREGNTLIAMCCSRSRTASLTLDLECA